MTNEIIEKASHHMDRSIEAIRETFHTVRAGKASTSVLDGVRVDYYGTPTPISQVANVSVPEARMILVQPWEKKMLDVIQKAIMTSDLGLNPGNDGNVIRVPLPELTEERRRDLVKQVHKLAEDGRVALRNVRRDANDHLKKALKAGEISEDEERRGLKVIQDLTDEHIAKVDELLKQKEQDILVI
ncbi:MAG: ribosome recycling factor [Calditrichaeota bacterium]|nr:ribosome recycling factor [Candidatus Cloacimonadota bacterium]MCA9785459.1 ribosome recycling factor [Candidatus Cloacimonadota bacterium]MCB1047145.1 ribosome recycling factor [Calditrichota bacterium]MCB9472790.1 ribosome recycling factor [Candidatus Delongbacteria bacterium]